MYNIAVTGVGGGVGQSILKSLEGTDYNLVALDGDPLGTGLYASKTSYLIPYANNENYVNKVLEICKKEKVSLLFPGLDAELMVLSENRALFDEIGTTVVVSRPEVITISDNKQETYNQLIAAGVKVPFTVTAHNYKFDLNDLPLIIKPKIGGASSKNVFVIKNTDEWESISNKLKNELTEYIVMEYIEGDEYTCGTINLDNVCKGVIAMKRILRDGDTYKCFSEFNSVIEKEVRKVVDAIKPFGACNVQLRLKNGIPYVFEINARCSGTTAARTLSGFNEPKMIADFLLKNIEPHFRIKEQTILRYWKEIVIDNSVVDELKSNKKVRSLNNIQL